MDKNLTFISSKQSGLFDLADIELDSGRTKIKMKLTIIDNKNGDGVPDDNEEGDISFSLMSATDIAGIKPEVIKHMAPAPFTRDAETTKLVHLDLHDSTLPWRYTPKKNDGGIVRPWLVLLVGTKKEIQIQGGIVNVDDVVLSEHNLGYSHLWAHIQNCDNVEIGRILSPRGLSPKGLLPQNQYVAVLVPAFNDEGNDMWTVNGSAVTRNFGAKGVLPAFHSWEFMTSESGDFETLAAALKFPPAGDVGKAKLYYRRHNSVDNFQINERLEIRGAITSIQKEIEQQEVLKIISEDLNILNENIENTIELPDYGAPWLSNPDDFKIGWPADLNEDVRYRGISGLGLRMGIEAQEALLDAAVQQSGALREAGQRIGNLAMSLISSECLWKRRMPTDKNERLRILGPMMSRMLATNGGTVMKKITDNNPLNPALFSSSAQRIIRDRSAQTRYVSGGGGGISWSEFLTEANQFPTVSERPPQDLPHIDNIAKEMGLMPFEKLIQIDINSLTIIWEELIFFTKDFCLKYRRRNKRINPHLIQYRKKSVEKFVKEASQLLQNQLEKYNMSCKGGELLNNIDKPKQTGISIFYSKVLQNGIYELYFYDKIWIELCICMGKDFCSKFKPQSDFGYSKTFCMDLFAIIPSPPLPAKDPIDLGQLSDLIFNALDPRQPDAPAIQRICSRLQGVDCTTLVRPEFEVGLDFPTWEFLRRYDNEWLLPGVNSLEKNTAIALQSNPSFIDAFMVGINTQFMSEMLWRDLAVNRNCTPLRMFWGQLNYGTQMREADIEPLANWASNTNDKIGALSHQTIWPVDPLNTSGNRLILVFRSDLFRRYPATLVYLVKPNLLDKEKPELGDNVDQLLKQTPEFQYLEGERINREFFGPTFIGNINPEITFFCFDVNPDELEKYWLVLDEPPTELRFRNTELFDMNDSSALFATKELDKPTRVAISGVSLKNAANHDNIPN